MRKLWVVVAIVIIVLLALAAFFMFRPSDTSGCTEETATTGQTTASPSAETATSSAEEVETVVISYENDDFSPDCVMIKSGETVTFVNLSDNNIEIGADPHPIHTGNKEVSNGDFVLTIAPGETAQVTISQIGKTGYHNHLNSAANGVIIVE